MENVKSGCAKNRLLGDYERRPVVMMIPSRSGTRGSRRMTWRRSWTHWRKGKWWIGWRFEN